MGQIEINDGYKGFIGLVSAVVFVLMIRYYKEVLNFGNMLEKNFWGYLTLAIVWLVVLIIGFIILYLAIKIIGRLLIFTFQSIYYKIAHWNDEARFIQSETIEIENLLSKVFVIDEQNLTKDTERLRNKMNICRYYRELTHFIPQLKKRLAKARELLEETRKGQYSKNLSEEIEIKEQKNKNLEEEIKEKEKQRLYQEETNERTILRTINAEENYVFEKDKLNKKEIRALLKNSYLVYSEYCIIKNKQINVLIKKKLNHSPTHIFLVWNTINLLKNIDGVKNIREHLSVDADITFNFNGKIYALEIETGTLLKKTKQKQEKVDYNNKKYKDGWMFIVSNRNLMKEYNELGFATQRKGVLKNIAKMLKIAHPPKVGVKPILSNIKPGVWH